MYSIKVADLKKDAKTSKLLWKSNFGQSLDFDKKFECSYLENPFGKPLLLHLIEDGSNRAVGIQGVSPRLYGDDAMIKAGLVADLAVDSNHRSLGPGLKLIKQATQLGGQQYDFLYGFPNKKAQPLYKRAGYELSPDVIRYAKPVRSRRFLKKKYSGFILAVLSVFADIVIRAIDKLKSIKYGRGVESEPVTEFDDRFDKLWNTAVIPAEILIAQRDKQYLTWRYRKSAQKDFMCFTVVDKNEGNLVGYIVYFIENDTCFVVDMFARDVSQKMFKVLLTQFIDASHKYGVDSISIEFKGLDIVHSVLSSLGFRKREEHVMFHAISPDSNIKKPHWYITSGDRDAI